MSEQLDIDCEHFLKALGMNRIERVGREVWFSCPFSGHAHGDVKQSASFRIDSDNPWKTFNCLGCGRHGTSADFLSELHSVSILKARKWIKDEYGVGFNDPGEHFLAEIDEFLASLERPPVKRFEGIDQEHLARRAVDWEAVWKAMVEAEEPPPDALLYMFRRGFTWHTLEDFNIGFDPISSTITIPYFDEEEKLVGMKGRAWWDDAVPKYRTLGDRADYEDATYGFPTISYSNYLFGENRIARTPGKRLIVVEGELNTMAMYQYGHNRVAGVSGQMVSDRQIAKIRKYADEVVIIFDETERALDWGADLEIFMPVYIVEGRGKDPNEASDEEVAGWLDGARTPLELIL